MYIFGIIEQNLLKLVFNQMHLNTLNLNKTNFSSIWTPKKYTGASFLGN